MRFSFFLRCLLPATHEELNAFLNGFVRRFHDIYKAAAQEQDCTSTYRGCRFSPWDVACEGRDSGWMTFHTPPQLDDLS
jgi:hypothetical protein